MNTREFSYIDAIEMSTYFENYDGTNDDYHLSQRFKDKIKKALGPIAGIGAAVGLGIAFGPALLGAIGPMLPAIKGYLIKQGVDVKGMGPGEKIKAFYEKVFKEKADVKDKEGPKKVIEKILKFFKDLKDKKAKGELGPLENALVETAEKTIKGIDAGTVDVADVVNDGAMGETGAKTGKSKEGVEVTTKIDTKIIVIGILAVVGLMYFSKK